MFGIVWNGPRQEATEYKSPSFEVCRYTSTHLKLCAGWGAGRVFVEDLWPI